MNWIAYRIAFFILSAVFVLGCKEDNSKPDYSRKPAGDQSDKNPEGGSDSGAGSNSDDAGKDDGSKAPDGGGEGGSNDNSGSGNGGGSDNGSGSGDSPTGPIDIGRDTLKAKDGWAAECTGTTGGSKATSANIVTVTSGDALIKAVAGDTPKIVYIKGALDLGGAEVAIGSNKTVAGLGADAKLSNGGLTIEGVQNVIVRNLTIGPVGDSGHDNIKISDGAHHIWVDHCTLTKGVDGLLDITGAANYITLSYNHFHSHDKTILIGSDDAETTDKGKLKVTLHHNFFENLVQRMPRVRFGEVHVYNNYFKAGDSSSYPFSYALGTGIDSKIYAENNAFDLTGIPVEDIIGDHGGKTMYEAGSLVNGKAVSLLDAYNAKASNKLSTSVGWKPTLFLKIYDAKEVAADVKANAGAGKLQTKTP